jgi:hypothetical protein
MSTGSSPLSRLPLGSIARVLAIRPAVLVTPMRPASAAAWAAVDAALAPFDDGADAAVASRATLAHVPSELLPLVAASLLATRRPHARSLAYAGANANDARAFLDAVRRLLVGTPSLELERTPHALELTYPDHTPRARSRLASLHAPVVRGLVADVVVCAPHADPGVVQALVTPLLTLRACALVVGT